MQTGLSSCRLTLLGMGLQKSKTNIKMNTKWLRLAVIIYLLEMMQHVPF
jgi:hypothetical protein